MVCPEERRIMGALVAFISRCNERINAILGVIKMLKTLRHRGKDAYGVSTHNMTVIIKDLGDLENLVKVKSRIAIGYSYNGSIPEDTPQPIEYKDYRLSFDGRIFSPQYAGPKEIVGLLERFDNVERFFEDAISKMSGSFSFVAIKNNKLILGRDPMGTKPLYFCENEMFFALASERKALWALGMGDGSIRSFPPGNLAEMAEDGMKIRAVKVLEKPKIEPIEEDVAIERLYHMLLRSIKEKISSSREISIGFSGGIDSSVLAALVKECGVHALLISVGLEGSKEIEWAEKVADMIGLPFKAKIYTPEDIEEILPKVLWLIEEANALKASIFIPIYWVAETSSKLNSKVMLSGQGSDEIFAGYHKYLRDFKFSPDRVELTAYNDVLKLHENTLEIEEKICAFHSVDVRFPYADYELASFALSLPVTLKIASQDDPLRKRILRNLAKHMGLPKEIYLKPKKAIQYGTGVSQALKRIAKKRSLSLHSLINRVFNEIRQNKGGNKILA